MPIDLSGYTENQKVQALAVQPILKSVVDAISTRQYATLSIVITTWGIWGVEEVKCCVETYQQDHALDSFDPFDVSCTHQGTHAQQCAFYFTSDQEVCCNYAFMTAGEPNGLTLQLRFILQDDSIQTAMIDLRVL